MSSEVAVLIAAGKWFLAGVSRPVLLIKSQLHHFNVCENF